ncbi:hypothetical protein TsFJ059_002296 [Trichoderma semiorbis]|uniref:Uncharacterized protein n=1 Tax=Trichoderma semiorbis TaxID=1491008 RepID=A0A9P8HJ00_9HYPO|nr:hypothetical protein TsFJ059_002296 [Trichoderma semiorbis]
MISLTFSCRQWHPPILIRDHCISASIQKQFNFFGIATFDGPSEQYRSVYFLWFVIMVEAIKLSEFE